MEVVENTVYILLHIGLISKIVRASISLNILKISSNLDKNNVHGKYFRRIKVNAKYVSPYCIDIKDICMKDH